jgi:hypothetical protein
MRFAMEQRRSAHGVRRAARYRSEGINNRRNRTGKLQYEEIIAGIGYERSQGKIKQHRRHNMNKNNDTNSIDKGTDSKMKQIQTLKGRRVNKRSRTCRAGLSKD